MTGCTNSSVLTTFLDVENIVLLASRQLSPDHDGLPALPEQHSPRHQDISVLHHVVGDD
jgi:hypothetical protein